MKWIEALKQWNSTHGGRYTVPRKGTPEHAEVKRLMEGGAKLTKSGAPSKQPTGYVKLLYAKNVNKMDPDDYEPPARPKKSAKRFNPTKIGKPSEFMKEQFDEINEETQALKQEAKAARKATMTAQFDEINEETQALKQEAKAARKATVTAPPPRAAKAAAPQGPLTNFFQKKVKGASGGAKKKTKATAKSSGYSKAQAEKDMVALGIKKKKVDAKKPPVKESGQISMMMRVGNHVMIAEPQAATIKVKGDPSALQADVFAPEATAASFTGFQNRAPETTAKQAARKFSPEELKVRPLSELFMTKPTKSLVEEQLAGKGRCWWMDHDIQEF
jgi:hypothetical protein